MSGKEEVTLPRFPSKILLIFLTGKALMNWHLFLYFHENASGREKIRHLGMANLVGKYWVWSHKTWL